MSKWKGSLISSAATNPSGTAYIGRADGKWSVQDQVQAKQANLWAKSINKPSVPTIGTATAGNSNASIVFTPSSDIGATGSLTYTATSSPGNLTGTSSSSPVIVNGLTNGTQYTFKLLATNSAGLISDASSDSNSTGVTYPDAPTIGTPIAGNGNVSVAFTAPSYTGGLPILNYTATSNPGGITGTGANSPILVSGLNTSTFYTFTVTATNAYGTSVPSTASDSVRPGIPPGSLFTAIDSTSPPFIAYHWRDYGPENNVSNPSILPAGTGTTVGTNKTGDIVAVGSSGVSYANFFSAYTYNGQFGAKYASPSPNIEYTINQVLFSPVADILVLAVQYNPFLVAYPFTYASGIGTKYANPATKPDYVCADAAFTTTGNTLIGCGPSASPYVYAYPWNNGFGTRYADPATLPPGNCRGISINAANSMVALATDPSPYLQVYNWSNGFGTKIADPSTLPSSLSFDIKFGPGDGTITVTTSDSPYVHSYVWSNSTGFGSKLANPATLPSAGVNKIAFHASGEYVALATNAVIPGGINTYRWSSSGFGTKYNSPGNVSAPSRDVHFGSI